MKPPADLWTPLEDEALIAFYYLGSEKAAKLVSRANIRAGRDRTRTPTACKRRVSVLRALGHNIIRHKRGPKPMGKRHKTIYTCISKPAPDNKPEPKSRKCLKCRVDFSSEGNWNHVCKDCKQSSEWTSACLGVARL